MAHAHATQNDDVGDIAKLERCLKLPAIKFEMIPLILTPDERTVWERYHAKLDESEDLSVDLIDRETILKENLAYYVSEGEEPDNLIPEACIDDPPSSKDALRVCINTHPALYDLRERTVEEWDEIRIEDLSFITREMREAGSYDLKADPSPDPIKAFKQFLASSPKLNALLVDIWDVCDSQDPDAKKNIVLFTRYPCVADIAAKVIRWAGTKAVLLTTRMSHNGRLQLVRKYMIEDTEPRVLVMPFTLAQTKRALQGPDGQGLREKCATVIFLDQPTQATTFAAAVGVVHGEGQDVEQVCKSYYIEGYEQLDGKHERRVQMGDKMWKESLQLSLLMKRMQMAEKETGKDEKQ